MSSTCVSVRVCSPDPKIGSGRAPPQHLADHVGDHVRDAGLVLGQLARPVGVEGTADRVRQPVLAMQSPAIHLTGQLREAVGRARRRAVEQVLLAGGELGGPLEHHRRRHVDQPLDALLQRGAEDGVVEAVVHLEQRVRELVEVGDPAHDRRQVDHVRAAGAGRPRLGHVEQVARVHLAGLAHPAGRLALVGHAHLPAGIAHQPAHHRGADRAGAAGHQHAAHWARPPRARARSRTRARSR